MSDRLEKLKEQRDQITARIRDIEARQRVQERKDDTRRKVLAGALALEHAQKNEEFGKVLHDLLRRGLVRPTDRALFGLDPLPEAEGAGHNPT